MSEKQKVLITGDVNGHFKLFFNRVENLNKKSGPFDFLLCVGNFFGDDNVELEPYKNGMKSISVPTYVIGPNQKAHVGFYPDKDGYEICQNLTYLGRRGLYTSSSGLKIAYLSGVEREDGNRADSGTYTFDTEDVQAVRNACLKGQPSFRGVDVLLTSPWPEGVTKLDPDKPQFQYKGSRLISWLAVQIKPRYHACGLEGIRYLRAPYRNLGQSDDGMEIATRFIALPPVGDPRTKNSFYALNLMPVDKMRLSELATKTTDETGCPYPVSMLSSDPEGLRGSGAEKNVQFFYDMEASEEGKRRTKDQSRGNKKPRMDFDRDKCWFCLSSSQVEKHLVVTVGTEVYVALAKGGLVEEHLLVLPVTHHQSLSILPENVRKEMEIYKDAIAKYYRSLEKEPVFFERNYKSSHCQLQAVPVHRNQITELKQMFFELADSYKFQLDEIPKASELQQIAKPGSTYFYAELPSGEKLFHKIQKDFPLQFGREVLASDRILDLNDRVDWKDCLMDKEAEMELVQKIRKQFQKFDVEI